MRLNDVQYFRLPLPHARKKMMMIHVIPRITNFHMIHNSITNPDAEFETKTRFRSRMLESKQNSIEIAFITRNKSVDQNKEERQDICVETESIESSNDPSFLTQWEDVPSIVRNDFEKFAEFPHAEDDSRETVQKIVHDLQENSQSEVVRGYKSTRKRNCGDRVEIEEEEKCGSWWKDGGQTILQFFAKILGKRSGIGAKGAMGYVLPTGKQPGKRVRRVSRGGKGHNGCRRDVDKGIRLKRVCNGYIADHRNRERIRHDSVTENKLGEKQQREQHHPSILVRQIQRTRDKNLRVILLEQELYAHLPKTTKIPTNDGINFRQLSSPLC